MVHTIKWNTTELLKRKKMMHEKISMIYLICDIKGYRGYSHSLFNSGCTILYHYLPFKNVKLYTHICLYKYLKSIDSSFGQRLRIWWGDFPFYIVGLVYNNYELLGKKLGYFH